MYQALIFPSPREARASSYAGKIGTGDEAREDLLDDVFTAPSNHRGKSQTPTNDDEVSPRDLLA